MDVPEVFGLFGLTRQETSLYLTLIAEGELSGYEAAKQTGISRSNAYAGLAALVAKGALYLLDGAVPRYSAVEAKTFFDHRIRELREAAEALVPVLPSRKAGLEGYLTITGRQAVVDRMKTMIEGASLRLYFALSRTLIEPLLPFLESAGRRGVKIVALSDAPLEIFGMILHPMTPPEGQIRLIVDSVEVLTGDWDAEGGPSCLYSRRPALVDLFKQALRNEIRLLEIGEPRSEP